MTELTTHIQGVIEETKKLVASFRRDAKELAGNLFFLRENKANGDQAWGKWVEENIEISQGFASKLIDNWERYIIQGGIDPERLAGIDYEKLYLASKTGNDAELNLARASTLSRSELRQTNVDEGHTHSGETVLIHKCCGMRVNETNPA